MAIIINNMIECPICKGKIIEGVDYISVPPLISNINDPIYKFSDILIHKDCLKGNKIEDKLYKYINDYNKRLPPSKLVCIVDNMTITNPRDLISIGLLTSDEEEKLSEFNFININYKNIDIWKSKGVFIREIKKFLQKGKWISLSEFNYLEYILNVFHNGLNR